MALYSSHDDRDPYDVVAQPPENGYDVAEDQKKNLIDAIGVQLFTALEVNYLPSAAQSRQ